LLEKYKQRLAELGGFLAVDSSRVGDATVTGLQKKLREHGSRLMVVKNKIFQMALQDADAPVEALDFAEQTTVMTYDNDPTVVAKLLKELQSELDEEGKMAAKFAMVDGGHLDSNKTMQLADIPSREELLAKLMGSLSSPVSGFVHVVGGNTSGLVRALKQISEKEE